MAPVEFTTRGSWKREFFRLTDTSASDTSLTEHDDSSTTLEGLYAALQVGLDSAQQFLLDLGINGWWTGRSSAITSWSGTDAADGGRYTALPTDFVRLAGDLGQAALVEANGDGWGQLVGYHDRFAKGNGYYLKDDGYLWLLRTASPPSTVYMEYIHRLSVPDADGTAFTDFPKRALALIPAYAAEYAMHQSWLPGGPEMVEKISRNLERRKQEAKRAVRDYTGPRRLRPEAATGNHW